MNYIQTLEIYQQTKTSVGILSIFFNVVLNCDIKLVRLRGRLLKILMPA